MGHMKDVSIHGFREKRSSNNAVTVKKVVCLQYLSALAVLIGTSLQRTVHLSFNPDEEIGGKDGLAAFVNTDLFKSLNVGFGMDEGLASSTEVVNLSKI